MFASPLRALDGSGPIRKTRCLRGERGGGGLWGAGRAPFPTSQTAERLRALLSGVFRVIHRWRAVRFADHNIRTLDTMEQMMLIALGLIGKRLRYRDLVT